MKLTIFDIKKYEKALKSLEVRKAPDYIIEAYHEGYVDTINLYYAIKLQRRRLKNKLEESKKNVESYGMIEEAVSNSKESFVKEAVRQRDKDFIKAFFMMSNMDIMSGEKLPPNASKLLKQGIVKELGLKKLFKKLR